MSLRLLKVMFVIQKIIRKVSLLWLFSLELCSTFNDCSTFENTQPYFKALHINFQLRTKLHIKLLHHIKDKKIKLNFVSISLITNLMYRFTGFPEKCRLNFHAKKFRAIQPN